jgi:hypothetical protein
VTNPIRKAVPADVPRIVELAEQKRVEYQEYQSTFWRKASDSREKHLPYIASVIERENVIALVHESDSEIDGFVIAAIVPAPPVYDPGGLTCVIDDFTVARAGDWEHIGAALLAEASRLSKERGAVQTVVVCGHLDEPKRQMLASAGYAIASEWYVRRL